MLLTISTTVRPATDLGFLLHKHPDRVQEFGQSYGTARVFYPEADEERCTAALMLDVDPVRLVRSRGRSTPDYTLGQYVNDRPYAASSLLAVALGDVFRTARTGRCDSRPRLAAGPIPLEIALPVLPCRGGPQLAHRLFEPLGWEVEARAVPLDEGFPEWGDSRYVGLSLRGEVRLADALNQLYVLLPVLDDSKHYWVASDEVDKLIRAGESWLAAHPERGLITRRYLGRRWALTRTAFARLAEIGDDVEEDLEPPVEEESAETFSVPPEEDAGALRGEGFPAMYDEMAPDGGAANRRAAPFDGTVDGEVAPSGGTADDEVAPDGEAGAGDATRKRPLNTLRREVVVGVLEELGAHRVIDLGCGSGQLVGALLGRPGFTKVAGTDVSAQALAIAARRLKLDRMPDRQLERLELFQGALTYTDDRFAGYDAAVLMEVIEHVDPSRLNALERVVFGTARPVHVIVTTPNVEYNVRYDFLEGLRHSDHRFEWTRAEFQAWAAKVCGEYGYHVAFRPIGDDDPEVGSPTQMALFSAASAASAASAGKFSGGSAENAARAEGTVNAASAARVEGVEGVVIVARTASVEGAVNAASAGGAADAASAANAGDATSAENAANAGNVVGVGGGDD
ncbi:3' terminal RNA ribose 2'-O-methyltransferase Hen1 [Streptosporangium subroseum]|uniref:3' terminal RNA ribose 2'-O-methyltransferase Hen1 n=1 Tax=Streptosporangium subroseum TaxID=106412 RepID=UPI00308CB0C8|nr:3' terminal RNA ribose 2'-O-methyltransferase Hen1 [Streptosporangium subroseum]